MKSKTEELVPIQVHLTQSQHNWLAFESRIYEISIAEVLRRYLDDIRKVQARRLEKLITIVEKDGREYPTVQELQSISPKPSKAPQRKFKAPASTPEVDSNAQT